MKILFSPSETKTPLSYENPIHEKSFIFPDLYAKRTEVLHHYEAFLQAASSVELHKLFGIKNSDAVREFLTDSLFERFTCKAIERYDGVAYDYLSYSTLDKSSQEWIDNHVLIFSNLFGPILAKDTIPTYKLQQGEALNAFKPETFYKDHFTDAITHWLKNETILDLRAGFYEKFYTLCQPYVTMKFLKKGKVVSHFAKAYRGEVLRKVAQIRPSSFEDLAQIPFETLRILEIKQSRFKHEFVYEIID